MSHPSDMPEHFDAELAPEEDPGGFTRRSFLQGLAASAGVAGLASCARPPAEQILPYTVRPPELRPGDALHFATSHAIGGWSMGLLVESHEGRPTKIEGNPQHPASLGASGVLEQLLVMQLYDPNRAREFRLGKDATSRHKFLSSLADRAKELERTGGDGLRLLIEPDASPMLAQMRARVLQRFPRARLHVFDPLGFDFAAQASRIAFGRVLEPVYQVSRADVIVCLDSDLLNQGPLSLRYAREFADRRVPQTGMNRLYVAEPTFTPTGTLADHRLPCRASRIGALAAGLVSQLGDITALSQLKLPVLPLDEEENRWCRAVAQDLASHPGRSLVVAGPRQPVEVQLLAIALNAALNNSGSTVALYELASDSPLQFEGLGPLVQAIESGAVDTLVIAATNPAFSAPADFELAAALPKVKNSLYLGYYQDETAALCQWFAPAAHLLESWGDTRGPDDSVALTQPLIAPLFDGLSEVELLAGLIGQAGGNSYQLLRDFWSATVQSQDFEREWRRWLSAGLVPGTAANPVEARFDWTSVQMLLSAWNPRKPEGGMEVIFAQDRKVYDGRFGNVAIAQELPEPITKVTWGNPALLSPALADRLGLRDGEVVELHCRGRTVEGPVRRVPGQADNCVVLQLGYGHRAAAMEIAKGIGFDAYRLRTSQAPGFDIGLRLRHTGRFEELALGQREFEVHDRPLVFSLTEDELRKGPKDLEKQRGPLPELYPPAEYPGHRWAMSIDLSRCTGCSACVLGCQTENNIPVVGRALVLRSRIMHWLRIDRYYLGPQERPETINQPMACQHCGYAPCEYVCPVNATVHSDEGVNEQVYNRCVGTRYCSNNCPYKVRRFNFLAYTGNKTPLEQMAMNPDVTVRARGVMEKCSYCIQRIERARIEARRQGKEIAPGAVVTACQQACPTQAIVFGDLSKPEEKVTQLRGDPRNYEVLHEQGTRPRTNYLARIKNPNPQLA